MNQNHRKCRSIVLVGGWGNYFLAFARRCVANGIAVYHLDTGDGSEAWRGRSACLAGGATMDFTLIGTPQGLSVIHDYARSVRADALIAIFYDEKLAWLARNRAWLEPEFKLLLPSEETLHTLASKIAQIRHASESGFDVLPTRYLSTPADAREIPADWFPLILRPDNPFLVEPIFRVQLVHTSGDLQAFMERLVTVAAPVIAQPFRKLPNLLVHGVRSEDGEIPRLEAFLGRRRYRGYLHSLERTEFPPGVERACRAFAESTNLTGCFHFDLLLSERERRAYYLEVNVRLGGTTDKVTRLGFDEPLLIMAMYELLSLAEVERAAPRRWQRVANKRASLGLILTALRGRLTEMDYPSSSWQSLWQSVQELLLYRDSTFDWQDLRGTMTNYLRPVTVTALERGGAEAGGNQQAACPPFSPKDPPKTYSGLGTGTQAGANASCDPPALPLLHHSSESEGESSSRGPSHARNYRDERGPAVDSQYLEQA